MRHLQRTIYVQESLGRKLQDLRTKEKGGGGSGPFEKLGLHILRIGVDISVIIVFQFDV